MFRPHKLDVWFDQTGVYQRVLAALCGTQQSRISKFLKGTSTLPVGVARKMVAETRRLGRDTPGVVRITMRDLMEGCPKQLLKSAKLNDGSSGKSKRSAPST